MTTLYCTQKLRVEMGLRRVAVDTRSAEAAPLLRWHANLLKILRRKVVLFTNDATLFNFVVTEVSREQIRNLAAVFEDGCRATLTTEGFDPLTIARFIGAQSISYAGTSNRVVLGVMNDLAFHYDVYLRDNGELTPEAVQRAVYDLNRMPMSPLQYGYSIESLRAALQEAPIQTP